MGKLSETKVVELEDKYRKIKVISDPNVRKAVEEEIITISDSSDDEISACQVWHLTIRQ